MRSPKRATKTTQDNPPSPKVLAAILGAITGTTGGSFLLWVLGVVVLWVTGEATFRIGVRADLASAAINAVPGPLAAFVLTVLAALGAGTFGYQIADPLRDKGREAEAAEEDSITGEPPVITEPEPELSSGEQVLATYPE